MAENRDFKKLRDLKVCSKDQDLSSTPHSEYQDSNRNCGISETDELNTIQWVNIYNEKYNYMGTNSELIVSLLEIYLYSSENVTLAYCNLQDIEFCSDLIGISSATIRRHLKGDLNQIKLNVLVNKILPTIKRWDYGGDAEQLIHDYINNHYSDIE